MNSRTRQMLLAGGVIGGGFLLWMWSKSSAANAAAASLTAGAAAPGVPGLTPISLPSGIYEGAGSGSGAFYQSTLPAPTSAQVAQQGGIWANLQPTTAPGNGTGWVNFPSGSQAAASLLPWRTDGINWYTSWAGIVYAVPVTTDQYGNYTAVAA